MIAAQNIAAQDTAVDEEELSTVDNAFNTTEFTKDSCLTSKPDVSAENQHGNRQYDAEKVAKIKAQIARGEYKIDPSRIVSRIIELKT